MSTAPAAKPETEVTIVCPDCHFQIPMYARRPLRREGNLRVDKLECPTCNSVYVVTVEKVRSTNLEPGKLSEVRNRNR